MTKIVLLISHMPSLSNINDEDFYADEQTNVFASHEYSVIRLLFCRLLSLCL